VVRQPLAPRPAADYRLKDETESEGESMSETTRDPERYVYIPLRRELYHEIVRREDRHEDVNVAAYVERAVEDFLKSTDGDRAVWTGKEYWDEYKERTSHAEDRAPYGDPDLGFQWYDVYLPNGTTLRMQHDGQWHEAYVIRQAVRRSMDDVEQYMPDWLATEIFGSPRDGWDDLFILRPGDRRPTLARDARLNPSFRRHNWSGYHQGQGRGRAWYVGAGRVLTP
jgi:hypothetical protein